MDSLLRVLGWRIRMTPEQREKHLKTIDKIQSLPRPEKWQEIRKLLFALHPELIPIDTEFKEACKEMRQKNESKTASSKSGSIRNTMKIPQFVYEAMIKLDPDLLADMSGRNKNADEIIGKHLYKAFPEYRIARIY